jgi:hypothetical protein
MEDSSKPHVLAAIPPPVKEPSIPIEMETRWAPEQAWTFWEK